MPVGITLEQIAAPGATPIAHNAASAKAFANNYAKLSVPNLSTRDRKTITVLAMIYLLVSGGGANYKTNHAGLIQDSQVYTGGISNLDFHAALAAIAASAANVADGTFSLDVPTLLKEGRDIDNLAEDQLDRLVAFLFAQMGL